MFNKKYIPAKIFVCVIFLCMFGAFGALAFRKTEKALRVGEFEDYVQVEIDWAKLYPFTENKVVEFKTRLKKSALNLLKSLRTMKNILKTNLKMRFRACSALNCRLYI